MVVSRRTLPQTACKGSRLVLWAARVCCINVAEAQKLFVLEVNQIRFFLKKKKKKLFLKFTTVFTLPPYRTETFFLPSPQPSTPDL